MNLGKRSNAEGISAQAPSDELNQARNVHVLCLLISYFLEKLMPAGNRDFAN